MSLAELASYMIEGGASRNYIRTKRIMYSDEILWRRLMGRIVDVPVIHLGTGASGFFRELHAEGGDVMGVDGG